MPTPPDPTGRPSSAKTAAPAPPSTDPAGVPLPPATGSTGSLQQKPPSSASGGAKRSSAESDIAQLLAHPVVVAGNSDDAPTVITKGQSSGTPQPVALPVIVSGEVPSIAGRKLGHYELIEAIGSGGMAAVLKARDTELGRTVALKILPPEAARDPESVTRFKQEGRAAAALDHENVARVYFCGEDQGLHFIAFEFVEGINLRQMIDRRGVLPAGECVRYMMQVAAGLNHAAERGVVHRDIKPSNILITPDGRAKIVDMGLARQMDAELVNGGVTQSGVTLGTFDYISPEQALDPRRADVRSDIYSLGCTFYHALTGRPPVPEGTAARKLRAHQNESPLDPRELNRAIPDELAAVLGRMMAKEPAARYQTPTELIAHLKGLAERLKLDGDALAHDSATKSVPAQLRLLPEAPRVRGWWVVAAVAVAATVIAFVIATSNPGPAPGGPGDPAKAKPHEPPEKDRPGLPEPPPGPKKPNDAPVQTVAQLVQKLEDPTTTKIVLAPGDFDLSKLPHAVAFTGKELELIGSPTGVTRLVVSANENRGTAGSLAVRADSVTVRNMRVEAALDPKVTVEADGFTKPVGLWLDDVSKVEFVDCVFTSDKACKDHDARAVAITRGVGAAKVDVLRCLFAPGWVGLVVPAGAQVQLTDCGFAPHSAVVLIDAPSAGDPPFTTVRLDRSSFMLDPGAAVVETGTPAHVGVTAGDCLFAPASGATLRQAVPGSPSESYGRGVVVRVRGEKPTGVQFAPLAGRTNGYYTVDPVGTRLKTFSFEDCKSDAPAVEGKPAADLKQRPWAVADPAALTATETNPWRAFKVKFDTDRAVLTNDRKPVPLGVWFHQADNVRRAYADIVWAFSLPRSAEEARTKVWWPGARDEDLVPGTYNDLGALLKSARPDDIVVIRHTGELPVDNIELKSPTKPSEGEFKITFRPEKGSRPVLVVQGDNDRDQTLFKLKAGEVTFDGLHFRLKPNLPKNGQTVAVVGITGGKSCTFKNCAFTLAEDDDSKVAAVHLPDIDKVMAMDPATRPVPKVAFVNCLVRGKGRAVWSEVSRPFHFDMTDSLTALDGPVLYAEAGGKVAAGASSKAVLTRVTALVGGPVVEMRGGKAASDPKASGLTKLDVETDECLFVAVPGAGRPLLELDGVDPTDVKAVLTWQVKKANRYAGFETSAALALIQPAGEGTPKMWTRDDWIGNVGEPPGADKRFGAVTFAGTISGLKDLAAVKPGDAVVKTVDFPDLSDPKALEVGAAPAKLKDLPPLVDEMKD